MDATADAALFTPDGRGLAVAGSNGELTLWDTTTGKRISRLLVGSIVEGGLSCSPDGRVLAFRDDRLRLLIWETRDAVARVLSSNPSIALFKFAETGRDVVVFDAKARTSIILDLATGRQISSSASLGEARRYFHPIASNGRVVVLVVLAGPECSTSPPDVHWRRSGLAGLSSIWVPSRPVQATSGSCRPTAARTVRKPCRLLPAARV
jgi:WD40 repeat protein